jgi:hypothetical protein
MARLVVKTQNSGGQVIELKLGINRLGRSPDNDFQIEHPTISAVHCEVYLAGEELIVRDCASTNGTFVRGEPIQQAALSAGQSFSLGDVEILVETTDLNIAIPQFDIPRPAPPVALTDGSLLCPRHPEAQVTHQCQKCLEVMCDKCVHRLRRRGGKLLKLCPVCSGKVQPLGGEKKKKKSVFQFLTSTVKLPFLHSSKPKN